MHSGDTGFESWPRYLTAIVSPNTNDDEVCIKTGCPTSLTRHKRWASLNCKAGGVRSTKSLFRLGVSLQAVSKQMHLYQIRTFILQNKMCHVYSSTLIRLTSV